MYALASTGTVRIDDVAKSLASQKSLMANELYCGTLLRIARPPMLLDWQLKYKHAVELQVPRLKSKHCPCTLQGLACIRYYAILPPTKTICAHLLIAVCVCIYIHTHTLKTRR